MLEKIEEHAGESNRRFVFRLDDGATVEGVLYRGDSLCVSCQVGCAVGCPFCASGAYGLSRALSLDELRAQIDAVEALGVRLRRVTLSGVGEPLHNRAVFDFLAHCRARGLAPSLTTSGGPLARLREAIHWPHNGLTISVHAGTEATRSAAVPHGPALEPLFATIEGELAHLSRSRRRKIALAYLAIQDLNEGEPEIDAFVERARPLGLWVHLYAYNPVPTSAHRAVSRARYEAIFHRMTAASLRVRMSCRARVEPNGGCGTLVALRTRSSAFVDPPRAAMR